MNRINYDKERNEVVVTGCIDCPFMDDSYERLEIVGELEVCLLNEDLNILDEEYYPKDCPLRDPNFKLTRNIK